MNTIVRCVRSSWRKPRTACGVSGVRDRGARGRGWVDTEEGTSLTYKADRITRVMRGSQEVRGGGKKTLRKDGGRPVQRAGMTRAHNCSQARLVLGEEAEGTGQKPAALGWENLAWGRGASCWAALVLSRARKGG